MHVSVRPLCQPCECVETEMSAMILTQSSPAHERVRPLSSLVDPSVSCELAVTPNPVPLRYLENSRSHYCGIFTWKKKTFFFFSTSQSESRVGTVDMSSPWEGTDEDVYVTAEPHKPPFNAFHYLLPRARQQYIFIFRLNCPLAISAPVESRRMSCD